MGQQMTKTNWKQTFENMLYLIPSAILAVALQDATHRWWVPTIFYLLSVVALGISQDRAR
jgi:hypothetical protein